MKTFCFLKLEIVGSMSDKPYKRTWTATSELHTVWKITVNSYQKLISSRNTLLVPVKLSPFITAAVNMNKI